MIVNIIDQGMTRTAYFPIRINIIKSN